MLTGLRARRTADAPAPHGDSTTHSTGRPTPGSRPASLGPGRGTAAPPPATTPGPGHPAVPGSDPPTGSGLRSDRLHLVAVDAAERAWELATGSAGSGLELDAEEDAARWAARRSADPGPASRGGGQGGPTAGELARATGLTERELRRRALAWRDGGREGFAVLVGTWDPTPEELEVGRVLLGPLGPGPAEPAHRRRRATPARDRRALVPLPADPQRLGPRRPPPRGHRGRRGTRLGGPPPAVARRVGPDDGTPVCGVLAHDHDAEP